MSQTRNSRRPLLAVGALSAALALGVTACGQGGDAPTESPTPTISPETTSLNETPAGPSAPESSPAAASPTESAPGAPTATAPDAPTETATASPAPPEASSEAPQAADAIVYWVALSGSGEQGVEFPGCGDLLVEDTVELDDSGRVGDPDRVEAGIDYLLETRDREVGQSGLVNSLYQSELEVEDASISGDTVTVELSGMPISAGTCDVPRIIEQLEHTAAANAGVSTAEVLVGGVPISEVLSQAG